MKARMLTLVVLLTSAWSALAAGKPLELQLRFQQETGPGSGRYHQLVREETWKPEESAVIVCDVWDSHHCLNAVRRVEEMVPRLEAFLKECRQRGVTVIHAPSDCMETYAEHPSRRRAMEVPKAADLPPDITSWCSKIPSEERGEYPIDQSDGGEDDDPEEHAQWVKKLESMGRDPKRPWKSQHPHITIDPQKDYISDRGDEVWSILQTHGIRNVILTGVHTNMCVLGRPFGLRQMARNGKNVVLVRDLTDTMYNPARRPFVSHFTGTDLIIAHIEKFVCPTISSVQLLGGSEFRFKKDQRPHVVMLMAEDEYETEKTLPQFAVEHLGKQFRVSLVFASESDPDRLPGLEVVKEADVLLVSIRRRALPEKDLQLIRQHVEQGKPVVGIRTASHAFSLRGRKAAKGHAEWPEFDAQVFGGNYHGHHANDAKSTVTVVQNHPITRGLPKEPFVQVGSLYKVTPLVEGTQVLLEGKIDGHPAEPVAWTFPRADGGRSFYTSLGHKVDFETPAFQSLLVHAIAWAAEKQIDDEPEEPLFHARPLTEEGLFTTGIEGPACDAQGNVYVVNFAKQGTIGRVQPDGRAELFVELPAGSIGNGIRFDQRGYFYVADYTGHNVLRVDPKSRKVEVFAHEDRMSQPNDLAIAPDGTLYASDPNWGAKTGQIWRIDTDGNVHLLAKDLGTTNGIEVSPDGGTLYVNESVQRNIWAFTISKTKTLENQRLVKQFEDHGFDGMRCDVQGNLYVTRHGKGTVVKLTPAGEILQEIDVLGKSPTNICFGGPDGRTAYVTEAQHRRLVQFRVDHPGASWQRWKLSSSPNEADE